MASTAPLATPRAGIRAKDWTGPEAQSASRRATCSREQGACGLRRPAGTARGGCRGDQLVQEGELERPGCARPGMLSRAEASDAGELQRA
eukprot:scaffold9498_cov79-Phaeocystis_antarctica.AAC.2